MRAVCDPYKAIGPIVKGESPLDLGTERRTHGTQPCLFATHLANAKRRKPLCSLWNGRRLYYIAARKQIYIPLYQEAVRQTTAYKMLEHPYLEQGQLTPL
jgi:hypothetical protein